MIKMYSILFSAMLVFAGNLCLGQAVNDNPPENKIQKEEKLSLQKAINDYGYPDKASVTSEAYKTTKQKWVAANPELYKKIIESKSSPDQPVRNRQKSVLIPVNKK
ncbi:MAG: hypothetical protein H0X62_02635 [Bacteroidetes bacterium]|nr:hypothetical protein [Bacteroidota bacterium]